MQTVLILFGVSVLLSVAIAILLTQVFNAGAAEPAASVSAHVEPPLRFFANGRGQPIAASTAAVPVDVLLHQIEQHVRLELAAAEAFHLRPTPEALHTHTISPLMH
jgi:hypothetical protein